MDRGGEGARMRMKTLAKRTDWEKYRQEMLAETARFIEWGLAHPEDVIEIPIKPANEGGFPARVGEWFWSVVLTDRKDSTILRWLNVFRGRRTHSLWRNR